MTPAAEETLEFYARQAAWSGAYHGQVTGRHQARAAWVRGLVGAPPKRALELGAGGGQDAIALAEQGYDVVAVEQVPALVRHAHVLLQQHPQAAARVRFLTADFYRVALPSAAFDVVYYWDGFGIGSDAAQRALLRRIRDWLTPAGLALIEVYTPWHAAKSVGVRQRVGRAVRTYDFDAAACRWIDRWQHTTSGVTVQQSLRCYSPADLRLLLEGTGLVLAQVYPQGMMDYARGRYIPSAPLTQAMTYVALLKPVAPGSA